MNSLFDFISAHSTICALVAYYTASAAIGSMPAPTSASSAMYQFWFKFLNTVGGNLTRAFNTVIEKSPNFQDALNIQQQSVGQQQTVVVPPPKP